MEEAVTVCWVNRSSADVPAEKPWVQSKEEFIHKIILFCQEAHYICQEQKSFFFFFLEMWYFKFLKYITSSLCHKECCFPLTLYLSMLCLCRCRFSTFKRWEWAVSEEELSMQSQNQLAQLLTLYKHTSFSFQSQFPWILPSHETAKMASDCNCAVNSCLWEHGVKQGVNLTEIIHMPPDGHNIQSLLDLNQRWEWKLLYYKHLISANA